MFRRVIMVIITVAFANWSSQVCSKFQIGSMFILQILYIIYPILLRPFEEQENNIIEIVNESVFTFLILICFTLPSNDDEKDNFLISYILREEIMSYTVIFSSLLVSLISTGILIGTQALKLKRWKPQSLTLYRYCNKSKTNPKTPNPSHSNNQYNQSKPRVDTRENVNFSKISKASSEHHLKNLPPDTEFFYRNRISIVKDRV